MKYKTILKHLLTCLEHANAVKASEEAKRKLLEQLDHREGNPREYLEQAIQASEEVWKAKEKTQRVPAAARDKASKILTDVQNYANHIMRKHAPPYSGTTRYFVHWGDAATAKTVLRPGDLYKGRNNFRKTDCDHTITLDPAGVVLLASRPDIAQASEAEGLPLLAYYPDGSAVWLTSRRHPSKKIGYTRGWLAFDQNVFYHSTVSPWDAKERLAHKLRAAAQEKQRRKNSERQQRWSLRVARMCHNATATLQDALELGYCRPGIEQFQRTFGIGATATLPELLKTKNDRAIRLALHCARKLKKHERPKKTGEGQGAAAL